MKSNIFPIIIIILLIGGIFVFGSSNKNPPINLAVIPPIPTLSPTNTPTITPTETIPSIVETTPTSIPTQTPEKINDKTQIIKATYGPPLGFYPNELTVKTGSPVRLEVSAIIDGRGCMSTIIIPGLDNRIQTLIRGQTNVFEFTPTTPGEYPITCGMGMPHGVTIIVQ